MPPRGARRRSKPRSSAPPVWARARRSRRDRRGGGAVAGSTRRGTGRSASRCRRARRCSHAPKTMAVGRASPASARMPASGFAPGSGHQCQVGAHMAGQGPAHHPAGGEVDNRGQVGPALPGRDVGDVPAPAGVELGARPEDAANEVNGPGLGVIDDGGLAPALGAAPGEPGSDHQPGHPLHAAADALPAQLGVDSRRPVGLLRLGVDGADPGRQLGVVEGPGGWGVACAARSRRHGRPRAARTPS